VISGAALLPLVVNETSKGPGAKPVGDRQLSPGA
jgi:hypothetical protein